MSTGTLQLDKESLAELIATIVKEVRKPDPPTQEKLNQLRLDQQHREDTAASVLEKKKNERWMQEHGCDHEHAQNAGGGTHAVYVRDNDVPASPGYILCQKCSGRFRPDEPLMRKLDPNAIFDTSVFNKLMQTCISTGEMFG